MLPKKHRITKQTEFDSFFGGKFKQAKGRSFTTPHFIFKSKQTALDCPRFGFVVSNKIDNRATVRNRLRRQSRDIIHTNLDKFKQNVDCLLVFKKGVEKMDFAGLEKELLFIFKTTRLL